MKIYIIPYQDGDGLHDEYYDYQFEDDVQPIQVSITKRVVIEKPIEPKQIGYDFEGKPLYKNSVKVKRFYQDVTETVTYYGWICTTIEDIFRVMKKFYSLRESDLNLLSKENYIAWEGLYGN